MTSEFTNLFWEMHNNKTKTIAEGVLMSMSKKLGLGVS